MIVKVKVDDLETLADVSGVPRATLAEALGLSRPAMTLKLQGERPLFEDEVGPLAQALSIGGRLNVSTHDILLLLGPGTVRRRGYVEDQV